MLLISRPSLPLYLCLCLCLCLCLVSVSLSRSLSVSVSFRHLNFRFFHFSTKFLSSRWCISSPIFYDHCYFFFLFFFYAQGARERVGVFWSMMVSTMLQGLWVCITWCDFIRRTPRSFIALSVFFFSFHLFMLFSHTILNHPLFSVSLPLFLSSVVSFCHLPLFLSSVISLFPSSSITFMCCFNSDKNDPCYRFILWSLLRRRLHKNAFKSLFFTRISNR